MIPEMWDWHMEYSPNHPVLVYTDDDGSQKALTWKHVTPAIHRAGFFIRSELDVAFDERPIVAILTASGELQCDSDIYDTGLTTIIDTISYYVTQCGILRSNCIAFPISPRNSPAAIAHLLNKVGVGLLLLGHENHHQKLASDAFANMQENGWHKPKHARMPLFEDLFKDEKSPRFLPRLNPRPEDIGIIIHSSGVYPRSSLKRPSLKDRSFT